MLQGAYTFGKAMNDADAGGGHDRAIQDAADIGAERAVAGYDVRPQARDRRAVGAAVLQERHRPGCESCSAAGSWRARRSSRRGIADQRRPTAARSRRATSTPTATAAIGRTPLRAGVKQGGWSKDEYLAGIFLASDFPRPAPGENGNLARNAFRGPGYVDVSLSLSKKFRVQRWSGEFRLDAFNALNRVNLADPNMDLSNTNFGRVTSQLAPRAFQMGVRLRF